MIDAQHERWQERLSEFMDGTLDTGDHDACEAHLARCGACRKVLEELRRVVAEAGALRTVSPSRDLWPGIAGAIEAPIATEHVESSGQVIALPTATRARAQSRRMWSTPQLAAAAVVLTVVSASLTWWAGPGLGARVAETTSSGPVQMASQTSLPGPSAGLATQLEALQGEVASVWESLDPETLLLLEQNLAVIEKAIADSQAALASDPANEFLSEHLDRAFGRKLDVLREAADIARWSS